MKYRRRMDLHSLLRPRNRQSWNKASLYNLSRSTIPPNLYAKTFFQQKWAAKALTRAYHGEHIKEHQWERMFSRRLPAVVEMDPAYMARHDGSEQAAGRGSGRDDLTSGLRSTWSRKATPYMHMTYAPMERRLDVAIFRALFASSARQARQFVVHGGVKVNGRKMVYPGYLLNPGDMFQVDIDRVLRATGSLSAKDPFVARLTSAIAAPAQKAGAAEADNAEGTTEAGPRPSSNRNLLLAHVLDQTQILLKNKKSLQLTLGEQEKLRKIRRFARHAFSRAGLANAGTALADVLAKLMQPLEARVGANVLQAKHLSAQPPTATDAAAAVEEGENEDQQQQQQQQQQQKQRQRLQAVAAQERGQQLRGAHAAPPAPRFAWRPRDYMSPFAFIPRYLEVNHRICAAVYLRHPVARQGVAEVPTPFPLPVSQLAFNWYLRRR